MSELVQEEPPTVADTPARRRASDSQLPPPLTRGTAIPSGTSGAASTSARDADAAAFAQTLRQAEIARTRRIVPFLLMLALAAAALVPIAGGDPIAIELVYVGIGCGILAIIVLYWLASDSERYLESRVAIPYAMSIITMFTAVYYWGIFSPAAALVALGIFFVTLGRSLRIGLGLYVLAVVCQGGLAVGVISGALHDRGLIAASRSSLREQIIQQVMLQCIYLVTYLIARATRVQLDHAVGDHDRAVRAVAQRDALLVEARQDLDQALKIGGPGRYSDQIIGSYRLGVVIGRGAMGDVYDAVNAETGAPAAIKLLGAAALATPSRLARFYREAEAVVKLSSPHIVKLYEVSAVDHALPYFAMERLRGQDLAQILRERRRLPLAETVSLVQQVARGLEAAREAGIVHRDIKPQNLYLAELGSNNRVWKILDFGVSKLGDHQGTLTKDQVIGTPMYMAPEQARGEIVDHRADGYALATVCYRVLTGQPPYGGRDVPSILYAVVHKIPQRPSELAKLPRDVDRVLAIALAKSADDRFPTALAFADALAIAATGKLSRELRERADAMIAQHPWSGVAALAEE